MIFLVGIAGMLSGLMIGLTMIFHIDTGTPVKLSEWMQTVGTVGAFASGVVVFAFDVSKRRQTALRAARVSAELLLPRLWKIKLEVQEFGSRMETAAWNVQESADRKELREKAKTWLELLPSSEYLPLFAAPNSRGLTKSLPRAISNFHMLIQGNSLAWESENDPDDLNPKIHNITLQAWSHITQTIAACDAMRYDFFDSLKRGYRDGRLTTQRWQQRDHAGTSQSD